MNLYLIILTFLFVDAKSKLKYKWLYSGQWTDCSSTCGVGVQNPQLICIQSTYYWEKPVKYELCIQANLPTQLPGYPLPRPCNLGDCSSRYVWYTGSWTPCSQTCGPHGRRNRDVTCVYVLGTKIDMNGKEELDFVASERRFCSSRYEPASSTLCNRVDCPPTFEPGKWGECEKSRECLPGKQRRPLTCISLQSTGEKLHKPRPACYMSNIRPPAGWRKCFDHVNTQKCTKKTKKVPEITTIESTLMQMRRTRKIRLNVGQVAYVLLYTNVVVSCPVTYFVPREIKWKHGNLTYEYKGRIKKRIKIDRKGRLRIRKFKSEDQGEWICVADSVNASAIIKIRDPSQGFQDWILRTVLFSRNWKNNGIHGVSKKVKDMQSDFAGSFQSIATPQWITSQWSKCSISCGPDPGTQTRKVQCEIPDNRQYTIVPDSRCTVRPPPNYNGKNPYPGSKPISYRQCQLQKQCPQWVLKVINKDECTNKCISRGIGSINAQLDCVDNGKVATYDKCRQSKKPNLNCPNKECVAEWKVSNWSACSKSCGGTGVQGRFLLCVWKVSGTPAGSACYEANLEVPGVVRVCNAPKCNLDCVDLMKECKKKLKYCRNSMYRFTCCKSCSQAYMEKRVRKSKKKKRPRRNKQ